MRPAAGLFAACLLALPALSRAADEPAIVFTNATVYTGVAEKPVENATLIVRAGKVVRVSRDELPAGAEVRDLNGAVIIPGLVDTHSHIGIYPKPAVPAHSDGNEMSGPVQSGIRALDCDLARRPWHSHGQRGRRHHGQHHARLVATSSADKPSTSSCAATSSTTCASPARLPDDIEVLGGLKMANGENPKGYGRNKQASPLHPHEDRRPAARTVRQGASTDTWQDTARRRPERTRRST